MGIDAMIAVIGMIVGMAIVIVDMVSIVVAGIMVIAIADMVANAASALREHIRQT